MREKKYFRLLVRRDQQFGKPYFYEHDVEAGSAESARNALRKYCGKSYGRESVWGFREISKEESNGHTGYVPEKQVSLDRAVELAKEYGCWHARPGTVVVEFIDHRSYRESVELNLTGPDMETELKEVWKSLHEDLSVDADSVTFVAFYND